MSQKVFIVGSRKFPQLEKVRELVRRLPAGTIIVTGTAPEDKKPGKWGVDETAVDEARKRGLPEPIIIKPDYTTHGRPAPLIRNKEIVETAVAGYVFWDGQSNGTRNALDHADRLGRPYEIIRPDEPEAPAVAEGEPQGALFDREEFVAEQTVKVPRGEPKDWWTLAQVRAYCRSKANKGLNCPVCRQRVKVYKRKLNATMARVLVLLYRKYGEGVWFHLPTFIKGSGLSPSVGGDTTKTAYWGLLESEADHPQPDGNPHTGRYRITALGGRFIRGETRVRKYVRIYDGRKVKCEDESETSITEALEERFSYADLMRT